WSRRRRQRPGRRARARRAPAARPASRRSPALAQAREHVARELRERALLVVAEEVEHELLEPELDVGRDLLNDLVKVIGDDEAREGAVLGGAGEPLHLDRVLDAGLLLARERERGPPLTRLPGVLGIVVVGDLDLDHLRDLGVVLARLLGALLDLAEELFVEVG